VIDTAVVLNPGAGSASAEARGHEIVDRFAQYGRAAVLFTASEHAPVAAQAHAAVDARCRLLVAAVAVAHRIPLGVLPIGALNHFVKDLGLPLVPGPVRDECPAPAKPGATCRPGALERRGQR
jgi:diacylglycerol kinase family enzyme